jgi:hypothetical protein
MPAGPASRSRIDELRQALADAGLRPPAPLTLPRLLVSRGQCASLLLDTQNGPWLHLKLSDYPVDLADEFKRQQAAFARFGPRVPQPLACGSTESGLRWLASAAQPLSLLSSWPAQRLWAPRLLDRWTALLATSPQAGDPAPELAHAELLRLWPAHAAADAELPSLVAALTPRAQHGDLWLGNLGMTAGGLWVFDWEDYGRLHLPGLDLHTLLASAPAPRSPAQARVRRAFHLDTLKAMGLDAQAFERLRPLYRQAFQWLKLRYPPADAATCRQ